MLSDKRLIETDLLKTGFLFEFSSDINKESTIAGSINDNINKESTIAGCCH
jgi:hypothetical protein